MECFQGSSMAVLGRVYQEIWFIKWFFQLLHIHIQKAAPYYNGKSPENVYKSIQKGDFMNKWRWLESLKNFF